MKSILVLYYSKHGSTQKLAEKIALGIELAGETAMVRTVPELTTNINDKTQSPVPQIGHMYASQQDIQNCSGLAMGSPTHFGNMASPLKYFIDSMTQCWLKGSLVDKPACVFTSTSSMHGGQESTLLSMMLPLFHQGMCILGLPYTLPELHSTVTGCSPYGVSSIQSAKGSGHDGLSDDEVSMAIEMGKRLAIAARKLND
jgi:NAD(P)H dehydrogenase (quinone)